MIQVIMEDMTKCTGCSACVNACPKSAIKMEEDKYGFLYPFINQEKCINCEMCRRVCPVNTKEERNEIEPKTVAAYSLFEDERENSSSGGIFSLLAKKVISEGGIVSGVELDKNFTARHSCASKITEIKKYRGSKYIQSEVRDTFKQIKYYLDQGKKVLFSGTSCQVAGLKSYLGNPYKSLICVDFVCFGVPSPLVFKKYMNALKIKKGKVIKHINFRSKVNGWTGKRFSFEVVYSDDTSESELITSNPFHRTFFGGLNARTSCYSCQYKTPMKPGDLTLADFWGVEELLPNMDDGRGTSIVFINTLKGELLMNELKGQMRYEYIDYNMAIKHNQAAIHSLPLNPQREKFFREMMKDRNDEDILKIMKKYTEKSFFKRTIQFIKRKTLKLRYK